MGYINLFCSVPFRCAGEMVVLAFAAIKIMPTCLFLELCVLQRIGPDLYSLINCEVACYVDSKHE